MIKRPFKAKGNRAIKQLILVNTNVCGPMSVQARGEYEYFITFINESCYSRDIESCCSETLCQCCS